jgi:hypothetical protein
MTATNPVTKAGILKLFIAPSFENMELSSQ